MSGAAILCASAVLRGGAGLVRLAVPRDTQPVVAAANPCYMTAGLPQDDAGRFAADALPELLALAQENDVLAVGPGLGRSEGIDRIVAALITLGAKPMVLDADGLNSLLNQMEVLKRRSGPVVLTPHPGEFARLLGAALTSVQFRRQELACRFAAEHGVILVLKGHQTIVTDGERYYANTTGNPGMATGGTGDVLTGLIAALLAQKLTPFDAASLGVYLHGLAGDYARDTVGEVALIASDLLEYLPRAFRSLT